MALDDVGFKLRGIRARWPKEVEISRDRADESLVSGALKMVSFGLYRGVVDANLKLSDPLIGAMRGLRRAAEGCRRIFLPWTERAALTTAVLG
jgi:hypothetical protein